MTFGQGWHAQPEDGWRWAYEDASLSYFNPYPEPITVDLRLTVVGATPRELLVERDGEPVTEMRVSDKPSALVVPKVELTPGVNRFKVRCREAAVRLGTGRNQLRSFGVQEARVEVNLLPVTAAKAGRERITKS